MCLADHDLTNSGKNLVRIPPSSIAKTGRVGGREEAFGPTTGFEVLQDAPGGG